MGKVTAAPTGLSSVLRFSVAASDGQRSMTWRVWTGDRRPSNEVYVAPRHMAGDLKFSAHSSGYTQMGPTRRLRDRSSPDDRYALSRTELGTGTNRCVMRLYFHRSELRPRTPAATESTVELRDDEEALAILVVIGAPPPELPNGWRITGTVARISPDPVVLIAGPIDPAPRMLAGARGVLAAPHQVWRMNVDWEDTAQAVVEVDVRSGEPPSFAELTIDNGSLPQLSVPLAGFAGDVVSFDDLPVPMPEGLHACAVVWVGDEGRTRLYVNEYARCDHEHLVQDVSTLLRSFKRSGPDAGWDRLDGAHAAWVTTIVTGPPARCRILGLLGHLSWPWSRVWSRATLLVMRMIAR